MAKQSWNDIYRKTIQKIDKDNDIKVSISALKEKCGKIGGIITHLRWYFKDKPTKLGITLNTNMLSLLWKHNEDHHKTDDWVEESSDFKISFSFGRSLDTATIATTRNKKSGSMTLEYSNFRDFIHDIPCYQFIINSLCTERKERAAEKALTVMMTHLLEKNHSEKITQKYLENQLIYQEPLLKVLEDTLDIPHSMMLSVVWDQEFINTCSQELKMNDKDRSMNMLKVLPVMENERHK